MRALSAGAPKLLMAQLRISLQSGAVAPLKPSTRIRPERVRQR